MRTLLLHVNLRQTVDETPHGSPTHSPNRELPPRFALLLLRQVERRVDRLQIHHTICSGGHAPPFADGSTWQLTTRVMTSSGAQSAPQPRGRRPGARSHEPGVVALKCSRRTFTFARGVLPPPRLRRSSFRRPLIVRSPDSSRKAEMGAPARYGVLLTASHGITRSFEWNSTSAPPLRLGRRAASFSPAQPAYECQQSATAAASIVNEAALRRPSDGVKTVAPRLYCAGKIQRFAVVVVGGDVHPGNSSAKRLGPASQPAEIRNSATPLAVD